jgi:hypothetical protein
LAINVGNSLTPLPGFAGTDVDEMDISYILAKPSYFTDFTVTTATAVGARVYTTYLSPEIFMGGFVDWASSTGLIRTCI